MHQSPSTYPYVWGPKRQLPLTPWQPCTPLSPPCCLALTENWPIIWQARPRGHAASLRPAPTWTAAPRLALALARAPGLGPAPALVLCRVLPDMQLSKAAISCLLPRRARPSRAHGLAARRPPLRRCLHLAFILHSSSAPSVRHAVQPLHTAWDLSATPQVS